MRGQRFLDLLAIGRVSNLPTVWSNMVTGFLLAWAFSGGHKAFIGALPLLLLLLLGTTFAYLFGTFLNDWKDAEFDDRHRPERAIPSGRWSRKTIGLISAGFALASLGCLLPAGSRQPFVPLLGTALLAAIIIYTALHKRTPFAIIPMGMCRSLLYLMGYCAAVSITVENSGNATGKPDSSILTIPEGSTILILVLMAVGIFSYVAGLTLAARYESRATELPFPRIILWALIFLCVLTHTWWWISQHPSIPALFYLLPFLFWTVQSLFILRKSIPGFVSRALAGLCLLDLLAFAGIAPIIHTGWHALDSAPLCLAFIPLSCFLFSILLQRIAPAT